MIPLPPSIVIVIVMFAGQSTNFGLKEAIALKWKKLEEIERHGDYKTSYGVTYR